MYRSPEEARHKPPSSPSHTNPNPNHTINPFTELRSVDLIPHYNKSNSKPNLHNQENNSPGHSGLFVKSETLNFSRRSSTKQGFINSKEVTTRSRPSVHSNSNSTSLHQDILEAREKELARLAYEKMRKENEDLKTQHKLLLNHLVESGRALENLNQAYECKCEEVEALKGIISSTKQANQNNHPRDRIDSPSKSFNGNGVLRYRKVVNFAMVHSPAPQDPPHIQQNNNPPQKIPFDRKASIKHHNMDYDEDSSEDEREYSKIEEYTRKKCVKSIKGSAYDLTSSRII